MAILVLNSWLKGFRVKRVQSHDLHLLGISEIIVVITQTTVKVMEFVVLVAIQEKVFGMI